MKHLFPYEWTLKDAVFTKDKGKVFSCFACGGGSTMGYKLAGFDVIGFNEIDPKMAECYIENHKPKYSYIEPIQDFKNRDDLPEELYNLDILDGSPPCSSFSVCGNREKDWGKEKKFKEGQVKQILDTLFFDFIDLAKKLQPKIVIAENVKGLLMGEAKEYLVKIIQAFEAAGYRVDYKLLNASKMGVPQKRERVFFYAVRNDIEHESIDLFGERPFVDLDFNEKEIPFKNVSQRDNNLFDIKYHDKWDMIKPGTSLGDYQNSGFNCIKVGLDEPLPTIAAGQRRSSLLGLIHPIQKRALNDDEFILCSSFPTDYNFLKEKQNSENFVAYIVGMSVPPVMTAQIATRVYNQWLK